MKFRDLLHFEIKSPNIALEKPRMSLAKYSGKWDKWTASHLLERVCFGFTRNELSQAVSLELDKVVEKLLNIQPLIGEPVYIYKDDEPLPFGEPFYNKNPDSKYYGRMIVSHLSWWMGQILNTNLSITQKMMLFWRNHFAIETSASGDAYHFLSYFELLYKNALGNCKTIAEEITINPAMLVYLNGNTNVAGKPNENYARELFELFTIGKGAQIGEGNYTNYTEADILAAAKVLTGWSTKRGSKIPVFNSSRHDKTNKQFSSAFNNKVIMNKEEDEYKELISMIFEQKETARNFCRKIYRWFVHYIIDDEIEEKIIEPLADLLMQNNYEIKPVLETLLKSEHFFDLNFRGSMIKNPIDFISSLVKTYEIKFPVATDTATAGLLNQLWSYFLGYATMLDMSLANPPSVAGYPAYYQSPAFYRIWISSTTVQLRQQLSDGLISANGITTYGYKLIIDPLACVEKFDNPENPDLLIDEASIYLFPFSLTENQRNYLRQALLGTIPDYEWTKKWEDYKANPNDKNLKTELATKLRNFFKTAFSLAEFQLI